MKRFHAIIMLVLSGVIFFSCKKENNRRTSVHENLYPRMIVVVNIDSATGAEMDTAGIINYYKQSAGFDYDSIGFWDNALHAFINYKVMKDAYGAGSFDIVADSINDTIPFFYLRRYAGAASFINNNVSELYFNYTDCSSPGDFGYESKFSLYYDSINRIHSFTYVPNSTRCAYNGNLGTNANYTFSSNEDTCFIIYDGDYFGCQDRDTIIYYDDFHRSKIPYLGYTYLGYSDCSLRFSNGFDVFPYSNHNYKLIKEVRTAFWNTSPGFTIPYMLTYSYQFDNNDNVKEVIVKVSNHLGGYLKDYKIKFYY